MTEINKIVIKKYPNRRLYNTSSSSYITLEDLFCLVKAGHAVQVLDAKTQEDLTSATLTQVLLEQEIKGCPLLPTEFLQMIIRFYDHPANAHWQQALQLFMDNWNNITTNTTSLPFNMLEWPKLSATPLDFAKTMQDFFTDMHNSATKGSKKK